MTTRGRNEALRTYLVASFRERRQAVLEIERPDQLPFITISRQAGAGGRSLAAAILAEFESHPGEPVLQGWSSFDRELCEMVATDPELNVSLNELLTEEYRSRAEDYVSVLLGRSFQDEVQKKISVAIRELALLGKAIVVGRGGSSITADIEAGVHVRLVAPREVRVRRMMESFSVSEKESSRWVDEQDRSRAKMMKSRFGADIEDPLLYHAVWNTDRVSFEQIARSVCDLVRTK